MRPTALVGALALAAAVLLPMRVPGAPPAVVRTMAVTVDDLPALPSGDLAEMRRITDGVLDALRRHGISAVGFVNEIKLAPVAERSERVALLRSWLDHGHDLGNHTYSHPDLQRTPLAEYQQDVLRGEPALRELLEARGGALRGDAAKRGDAAMVARLRTAYLDHTLAVTEAMEALARDSFGREIPQVLLVHANRTNVETLDELLERLAARGYRFVSLKQALADPAWLHRFRVAKGLPVRLDLEPDPPAWVLDRFREVQAR